MTENYSRGKGARNLVRRLCFIVFGICAFLNPLDKLNIYNIIFGAVAGLLFGWLFRRFLNGFLGLFNRAFKKETGKEPIRYAVDTGMLFLSPFALMMLLATFYLEWSMTVPFISAGVMAVGTASSIEVGRMKNKPEIKNTIAASGVSFAFSFLWTFAYPFLFRAPALLEGGVTLVRSLLGGGGGV